MRPEDQAGRILDVESVIEQDDSSIEDTRGAPSWPIRPTGRAERRPAPPVGLNWTTVAERLGVDREVLEHDGMIVLRGEFFPTPGFFIDPETLDARHVDVGDIALRPGYLVGDLTVSEFNIQVPIGGSWTVVGKPVITPDSGAVIGLFSTQTEAERAKRKVLQGSLGSGISLDATPLGVQLRVGQPELAGRVATIMAAQGGAVVSVGGKPTGGAGAMATASSAAGGAGDAWRPGTGADSDSEGPEVTSMDATEAGEGEEFSSL